MQNELFETAPVHKAYFKLALPVVFGMVVSLIYNMVDTYFIAGTGNTNLVAGVSIGAPVFTLMVALGDIFGLGGSSIISRLFGEKHDKDGKRISVFCFYGAFLCGIIVMLIMMGFRQPILHLLGADTDTIRYASQYYTGIVLGSPFIIFSLAPSNLLRTEGMANESMVGTVLGAVVNMILDPIFISVLGLGAAGAAVASVIGYVCTDIYFFVILWKKSKKLSVNPNGFYISKEELGQIFAIGIPASITNLMQSIGIALMNRMLLSYGNEKVAAMGIVMKVNMIAVLILVGFAFGGQPLIGYNYGARNKKRVREILKFCYLFECGLAIALAIVLSVSARPMIHLFMANEEIVAAGTQMLRFQQMGMPFVAIVLVTTCLCQSAGKAFGAFLLSVSRQGVIFAIVIFTAAHTVGYNGVIASQAVSDFLTAVLAVVLFLKYFYKEIVAE